MDWDDLRYVLAVARHGTIQAAAEAMRVNGTTVSRRVRGLEQQAGAALFDKLRHGVVLTPAGQQVVAVAESMEQLAHELDARIHGLDSRLEGTLRVTTTDMLAGLWMDDWAAFREHYPRVRLELLTGYALANLTRREADVAVRISESAPPHLIGRKYAEVYYAVYGSDQLIERVGCNASYGAFPWIAWDLKVSRATDVFLHEHVRGAQVVMRVDTMPIMTRALQAGMGITIMPCLSADTVPGLRRVGDYFEGGLYLWLLTHAELKSTARVRALMEHLRELVERDSALIAGQQCAS